MSVIAVGNFDGVHSGHRRVLRQAVALAAEKGTEALAVTFSPHPRSVLTGNPQLLLSDPEEKQQRILSCGIHQVITLTFDSTRAEQTPEAFLRELKDRFACTDLVCGENFRFGNAACGYFGFSGEVQMSITGHLVPAESGVSSSAIRTALAAGDVTHAAEMLGEPYGLSGTVVEGKHLGRTIGFPTLNFWPSTQRVLPQNGVYVTQTQIEKKIYASMTNVGRRPTVEGDGAVNIETFLLYLPKMPIPPAQIRVCFLQKLRGEVQFSSLEKLQEQLMRDQSSAEAFFERK